MSKNKSLSFNIIFNILSFYDILIASNEKVKVDLFSQGYMNTVVRISTGFEKYVLCLFNPNRYSDIKSKQLLEDIHKAVVFLDKKNLPVSIAYYTLKNETVIALDRDDFTAVNIKNNLENPIRLVSLYKFLEGQTIPWEAYTRRHIRAVGRSMHEMHKLWQEYKTKNSIYTWKEYFELDSESLLSYFVKNMSHIERKLSFVVDIDFLKHLIENILHKNKKLHIKNNSQLIHGDFVRGNILFSDEKKDDIYPIVGILDFEKVMYAPIEVDVARTVAFMYVDCKYKTKEDVDYYFFDGYGKKVNDEYCSILINYFLYRDLWKLLACNPYESLKENEHYVRTVTNLRTNKLTSEK